MKQATPLDELQTAVVATLKECGLSAVLISADGEHNRYTIAASNGGGGVFYNFYSLEELRVKRTDVQAEPVIKQASLLG